jgi:hypothetical protein
MPDFILKKSSFLPDISCPLCGTMYDIEWFTEYGDFLPGCHETTCEECESVFGFEAQVKYISWTDRG